MSSPKQASASARTSGCRAGVLADRCPGEGVAACLLDCADDVRLARIGQRAVSGRGGSTRRGEVAGFLRAAARMQETGVSMFRLDTSTLDAGAVASRLEDWKEL